MVALPATAKQKLQPYKSRIVHNLWQGNNTLCCTHHFLLMAAHSRALHRTNIWEEVEWKILKIIFLVGASPFLLFSSSRFIHCRTVQDLGFTFGSLTMSLMVCRTDNKMEIHFDYSRYVSCMTNQLNPFAN